MAKQMKQLTEDEINVNASFFDAEIIPNVYYQVYGFDKVFCHDDEGVNYKFNNEAVSHIQIQVVTATERSYYQVGELDFGDAVDPDPTSAPVGGILVDDFSAVPDNAKVGDICYTATEETVEGETTTTYAAKPVVAELTEISELTDAQKLSAKGSTESTSNAPAGSVKDEIYYHITETLDPDSPANSTAYEYNKYGTIKPESKIYVTLNLSNLKTTYTTATVNIDGKDYDLGIDGKTIPFIMNKDHKIQINWVYGEIVETFRIICNR